MYEYVKALGDKIEYKNTKELNKIVKNSFNPKYIKSLKNKKNLIEEHFVDDLKYLKKLLNSYSINRTKQSSGFNDDTFDNIINYFKCISKK